MFTRPFSLKEIIIFNIFLLAVLLLFYSFLSCKQPSSNKKPYVHCFLSIWSDSSRELYFKLETLSSFYENKINIELIDIDNNKYISNGAQYPFERKQLPVIIITKDKKILKEIYYANFDFLELKKELDTVLLPIIK